MSAIIFKFGDGEDHDASVSEKSAGVRICFPKGWSLIPEFSGLDQNPTWTLEVANVDNDADYDPYTSVMEEAAIDQGFDDNHWTFRYARINYNAQTNTTGTVKFDMEKK